jgi:hypothetical protein
MTTRKWLGVAVGVLVIAVAVFLWRRHGAESTTDGAPGPTSSAKVTTGAGGTVGRDVVKKPDPQKQPRGSIAGTVRDEAKAPLAGIRVCVDPSSDELPMELMRDPICKVSDAQGTYKFEQLFAANYTANAGGKPYRPTTWHVGDSRFKTSRIKLAAGEARTGIDFVMRAGGAELRGTVSDISGGPIAHAQIRASNGRWGQGDGAPMVETDDKGVYSVWLAPGDVRVQASADGYAASTEMGEAPGKIDLLLTPESGLSGIVVDAATGKPIEGANVSVESTQWSWDGHEGDKSDAEGKFKVRRLPPGRYVASARTDHGYGRTEGSVLVGLGQQVDGVVVKLFPAARIVGKVMIEGTPPTLCTEASAWFRDEVHDRWVSGTTEDDGTIHADGVLPGTYTAQVQCEGYRAKDKYPPVVVEGKDLVDQTWLVEAGSMVKGKLTNKAGAPIADAQISAQTTGGDVRAKMAWAQDRTQADGSYELRDLTPATYRLRIDTDKGVAPREDAKVEVPAATTVTKDLVVEDGGTIKGVVVDSQGVPVDDVTIDARPLADRFWWNDRPNKSKEDGSFLIDALRGGDYRVIARRSWADELRKPGTNDDAEQGEKVTVVVGKTVTVKLVVEAQTGVIKGTVVDTNGSPISDAFISAVRESDAAGANQSSAQGTRGWGWGDEDKPVLTGTDGTFTITKLAPGKHTLRAYRKGGGEAIAEHVAVGTTVKLQIKHVGSIEGMAKRAGGGALPDELAVSVEDLKTGFARSEAFYKTNGHFIIHDLPAGHFTLTVSAEGGQQKIEVDLSEGQQKTGIEVTLEDLVTLTGRVVDMMSKQPVMGLMVFAAPAKSNAGFSFSFGDEETGHISDAAGKFTVKRAPKGKLAIQGMAKEWKEAEYSWFRVFRTVTTSGTVDLGDIGVLKKRIKEGETAGKLGLHYKEQAPDADPETASLEVSFIEPNSPASKVDVKVGDVITSVDGIDVTGGGSMHAWTMMNAPVGTKLTIGLKRGTTFSVTLAPP